MIENLPLPLDSKHIYFSLRKAAEYLHVPQRTLIQHFREIPSYKFHGRLIYIKEELDRLVRQCTKYGEFFIEEVEYDQPYLTLEEAAKYLKKPAEVVKHIAVYEFFGHEIYKKKN